MTAHDLTALNIGFIGFGLIAGSIAKAIKRVHPDYTITVTSRSMAPVTAAKDDGIVDIAANAVDAHFGACDYIFLCTPVVTITKYLVQLKEIKKDTCIITDVGSVKGNIHAAVRSLGMEDCFIGGHPMAGSEQTGYANSSADLLAGARYVITPTPKTTADQLEACKAFITDLGAVPVVMDCKLHDYTAAGISHVPHLIAAGLSKLVLDNDDAEAHMHALAAGGFRDTTRIAASSPEMWSQICDANRDAVCALLDKYIAQMQEIRNQIAAGGTAPEQSQAYIEDLFKTAGEYRKSFS